MMGPDFDRLRLPACAELREALELHAEGELRDPLELGVVRRHLESCASCRAVLVAHDELTCALLAEEAPAPSAGSRRVDHILAALPRSRPHTAVGWRAGGTNVSGRPAPSLLEPAAPRGVMTFAGGPDRLRRQDFSGARWVALAAALVFGAAGFFFGLAFNRSPGQAPQVALVGSDVTSPLPSFPAAAAEPDRRWVLATQPPGDAAAEGKGSRLLRLYDFNLFDHTDPAPSGAPIAPAPTADRAPGELEGWVVEAAPHALPGPSERHRFYLVADGPNREALEPVTIRPVRWYTTRAPELGSSVPAAQTRTTYRVYVVPAAETVPAATPARLRRLGVPGLPWTGANPEQDERRWILPVQSSPRLR